MRHRHLYTPTCLSSRPSFNHIYVYAVYVFSVYNRSIHAMHNGSNISDSEFAIWNYDLLWGFFFSLIWCNVIIQRAHAAASRVTVCESWRRKAVCDSDYLPRAFSGPRRTKSAELDNKPCRTSTGGLSFGSLADSPDSSRGTPWIVASVRGVPGLGWSFTAEPIGILSDRSRGMRCISRR